MLDLVTVCDNNGKPLGHGVKVGNEYYHYLCEDFVVEQYVNADILPYIDNKNAKELPNRLKSDFVKIRRIFCIFRNLRYIYKKYTDDLIWVYVPDIYIFLFECLFFKKNRKIVNLVFGVYCSSKIKQVILALACRKSNIMIATNKYLQEMIPRSIYIPDYTYDEKYEKFQTEQKKEMVVCLGTMNIKKKIIEAVEVFSRIDYPLIVIGQFASGELYEQSIKNKGNNVIVENRYLSDEEYYTLLGTSKFCLLPYDHDFYMNQTSGVIQECMFLNTIPITHHSILEFSSILGIGYNDLSDLTDFNFFAEDVKKYYKKYKELQKEEYAYSTAKKCLIEEFRKVS